MNFSVLISIYTHDNPTFLQRALESIWDDQTLQPTQIVVVEDGPISTYLENIVSQFAKKAPVVRVRLKKNMGLGNALQVGVLHCTYELIARMDADDISVPTRFEQQIKFLEMYSEVDVLGSNISEFVDNENLIKCIREVPEINQNIIERHKLRNAINHVSVIFKKSKVIEVGNYQKMLFFEDYYLWSRMMVGNMVFYNIQKSLVLVRVGTNMIGRRKGFNYVRYEMRHFLMLYRIGFMNFIELVKALFIRLPVRFLPYSILTFFYTNVIRK